MIKDVPEKGIYTSKLPGEKKKKGAVSLKNGQILWASKKGSYEGKTYYHLRNGMYLKASENYTEELTSYEKLGVYVVDKVPIKGKVTLKNGDSAYITEEGLYLTTDIQYLNDYTTE